MNANDLLLHERILSAHEHSDSELLASLYLDAANRKRAQNEYEAVPFLLTQAYVFALESGLALADELHSELVALGSEV